MDSSYTSGGQDIPGAKPGVIASGPDTPDVPEITPSSENPNGILNKLSRKPSGSNKPMMVVDGGGGPKKPKNKLAFVGLALVGIALVVGIVAMLMMGRGNNNENSNSEFQPASDDDNTTAEVVESDYKYSNKDKEFYRYANYTLYGDKSVSKGLDLGIYNNDTEYSIYKAVNEDDIDFLRQSVLFWKDFYTKVTADIKEYNNAKEADNSGNGSNPDTNNSGTVEEPEDKMVTLEKRIELQKMFMDFVEKYAAMNTRTEEGMWKLYNEVGLDAAIKSVKADYTSLSQTIYDLGAKWATAKSAQAEAALNLYAKYDSLGCIKDNDYDQSCIDKNLDALSDAMSKYTTARSAVEATGVTFDDAFVGLVKNCFEIRDLLGEIEKEEDTNNADSDNNNNSDNDNNSGSDTNDNSTNDDKSADDRSADNA